MKHLSFIPVLLFIHLFSSSLLFSQQEDLKRYYPINIGNRWVYSKQTYPEPISTDISIIGDTVMRNGKKYYIFKRIFYVEKRLDTLTYERMDTNNCLYKYFPNDSAEYLLTDFNLPMGGLFYSCLLRGYWTPFPSEYNAYIDIKGGMLFRDKIISSIWITYKRYADEDIYIYYCYNLGIVSDYRPLIIADRLIGAIIDGKTFGIFSDVKKYKNKMKDNFVLFQNYPNPFNPVTEIKYNISEKSFVEVIVYDLLGKEITALYSGIRYPGEYQETFNASGLNSGLYICKINAGTNIKFIKMALLK